MMFCSLRRASIHGGGEGAQPMFTESLLLDIFAFIFGNEKVQFLQEIHVCSVITDVALFYDVF